MTSVFLAESSLRVFAGPLSIFKNALEVPVGNNPCFRLPDRPGCADACSWSLGRYRDDPLTVCCALSPCRIRRWKTYVELESGHERRGSHRGRPTAIQHCSAIAWKTEAPRIWGKRWLRMNNLNAALAGGHGSEQRQRGG